MAFRQSNELYGHPSAIVGNLAKVAVCFDWSHICADTLVSDVASNNIYYLPQAFAGRVERTTTGGYPSQL
jgi:hypothetical protein